MNFIRIFLLISIIFTGFFSQAVKAQNFKFSPSKVYRDTIPPNGFFARNIDVINTSSNPIQLSWSVPVRNMPQDWDYSLCDNGQCYVGVPDSGKSAIIKANSTSFFKFNVQVSESGLGTIMLFCHEQGTTKGDTIICHFAAMNKKTGIEGSVKETIKASIYPNPALDVLNINFNAPETIKLLILDGLGREVKTYQYTNASLVNIGISELPAGMYILKGINQAGNTLSRIFYKI